MTTDAATDATQTDATDTATDTDTVDWKAEAEKYKQLHRKQEDRAKANATAAKELEMFKQQSMTELERAVEAARNEGRSEGARAASERIVRADIRTAAAGRSVDVDALLDGINFARFIDADGESDIKAINAWMDKIAPAADNSRVPPGRPGPRNAADLKRSPADEFADFVNGQRNRGG